MLRFGGGRARARRGLATLVCGCVVIGAGEVGRAAAAPPTASRPDEQLPTSCAVPLEEPILAATPLDRGDLAAFIAVNRRVAEQRAGVAVPSTQDYLEMLEALALRDDSLGALYDAACRKAGAQPYRYLETERRVRQVAELLALEARRAEHRAERLALEETRRRSALEVVREHRDELFRVDRERIVGRIAQLEALLAGDDVAVEDLLTRIDALAERADELDQKLDKRLERREELERLAARHGIDGRSTARALDRLEEQIDRYQARIPELREERARLERHYRELLATQPEPVEEAQRALESARRELDALDRRLEDPEAVDREVEALERHLVSRGAELTLALDAIEERMAQPDMQQAARDRETVLAHMPELRGLYRLLPQLSDRLAERYTTP